VRSRATLLHVVIDVSRQRREIGDLRPISRERNVVLLLGIETSCDDTSAALVATGGRVLANVATNQDAFHARFGGIVPEIAGRQHLSLVAAVIDEALSRADCGLADLDGIAVTAGPGLIGSLVVGVAAARALAFARTLPLYAVQHLHGHLFAPYLGETNVASPAYPLLALLVSGGHTQLVEAESATDIRMLGRTRDDAAGEAFDKTARLLGLPFPGGAALDRLARRGDPRAIAFPRYRPREATFDFSFSGLKTAARRIIEAPDRSSSDADIAASFEAAVVDTLIDRLDRATDRRSYRDVVVSGGVAANSRLRAELCTWGERRGTTIRIPALAYCTDNAAMIAGAALLQGEQIRVEPLDAVADPNLPFSLTPMV